MKSRVTIRAIADTIRRIASRFARATPFLRSTKPDAAPSDRTSTNTVKIEWGLDFDKTTITQSLNGTPQKAAIKGRCAECWDSLLGRMDDRHQVTGIKCRVCAKKLEGDAARQEHARMQNEQAHNTFNMLFGRLPRYAADATFVIKTIPSHDPVPKEQVQARVDQAKLQPKNRRLLTRHDFPTGSPGFFMLQAMVLMASVEDVSHPDEWSIVDLPDVRFGDDGTALFTLSTAGMSEDPQYGERRLARRMGQTVTASMISAFACELTMKAIALTARDEALKTHDLHELYIALPPSSRLRIAADYGDIEALFKNTRQTFGAWRYFETQSGETAAQAMINTQQARSLGKAARVILDEAETMGLGYFVGLDAKERVSVQGESKTYHQTLNINIKGREGPPNDP